jgi:D-sedoheptulose 7-phosphate isomerase
LFKYSNRLDLYYFNKELNNEIDTLIVRINLSDVKNMNRLEDIYSGTQSVGEYAQRYSNYLTDLLKNIDIHSIEEIVKVFQNARSDDKTIFFIGNGGSAATCSHFSEDLSLGAFIDKKKPFKTISLVDNTSYITALGNDIGYGDVFTGQLRCLLNRGDVVVGISASGNSPNIVNALRYANSHGGVTVGIIGFDGGKMKEICQHYIQIETKKGVYGPVEDLHLILVHIISTYLMYKIQSI